MSEGIVIFCLGIPMALAAYFFQKWLGIFEDQLEKTHKRVGRIDDKIDTLQTELARVKEQLAKELQKQTLSFDHIFTKIEIINKLETHLVAEVLPQLKNFQDGFGKIILLEKQTEVFEHKLMSMFKAVGTLVERQKK